MFVLLLTEAKFKTFAPYGICDATKSTRQRLYLWAWFQDWDGHTSEFVYMEPGAINRH
jgi:predicted lactoylglutathione lyase